MSKFHLPKISSFILGADFESRNPGFARHKPRKVLPPVHFYPFTSTKFYHFDVQLFQLDWL